MWGGASEERWRNPSDILINILLTLYDFHKDCEISKFFTDYEDIYL
jgi:hypothetical protein